MPTNTKIKNPAWVIGVSMIALAIIAALVIILVTTKPKAPSAPVTNGDHADAIAETVSVKSSPPTGVVPLLPEDFPIDSEAQITNNYTASSEQTSGNQYTRAFTSKQTLSALNKTYLDYFQKNHWSIQAQKSTSQGVTMSAFKDQLAITVTIQQLQTARFVVLSVAQSSTQFIVPNQPSDAKPR